MQRAVLPIRVVGVDVHAKRELAVAVAPFHGIDALVFGVLDEVVFEVHHVAEDRRSVEVTEVDKRIGVLAQVVVAPGLDGVPRNPLPTARRELTVFLELGEVVHALVPLAHCTDIEECVPQIPLVLEQCEGAAPTHKRVVVVADFVPDKAHVRRSVGIAGIYEVIPAEQIKDFGVVFALVRAEINPTRQGQRLRRFVAEGGEHTVPVMIVEEFAQDAPGLQ